MAWATHEPPVLIERVDGDNWRNVAEVDPIPARRTRCWRGDRWYGELLQPRLDFAKLLRPAMSVLESAPA
jgi:hypothetical protein